MGDVADVKTALYFSAQERTDEDGHTDILGNGSGDTGAADAQFKNKDQEHVTEDI